MTTPTNQDLITYQLVQEMTHPIVFQPSQSLIPLNFQLFAS